MKITENDIDKSKRGSRVYTNDQRPGYKHDHSTQVDTVSIAHSTDPADAPYSWLTMTFRLRNGQPATLSIGPFATPDLAQARVALLKQALQPGTSELEIL